MNAFLSLLFGLLSSAYASNCQELKLANKILVPAKTCKEGLLIDSEMNRAIPALFQACNKLEKAFHKKLNLNEKQIDSIYIDALHFITPPKIEPILKNPPTSPDCELDLARYGGYQQKATAVVDDMHQKLIATLNSKDKSRK